MDTNHKDTEAQRKSIRAMHPASSAGSNRSKMNPEVVLAEDLSSCLCVFVVYDILPTLIATPPRWFFVVRPFRMDSVHPN